MPCAGFDSTRGLEVGLGHGDSGLEFEDDASLVKRTRASWTCAQLAPTPLNKNCPAARLPCMGQMMACVTHHVNLYVDAYLGRHTDRHKDVDLEYI